MDVAIVIEDSSIRQMARELRGVRSGLKRAIPAACNKVAIGVRSRAVKAVAQGTGLTQKSVREKNTKLYRATGAFPVAKLTIIGKGIPLRMMKPRQVRAGVTYKTPSGRKLLAHAFIQRMPANWTGVFLREGKARLPIEEQVGPNVTDYIDIGELSNYAAERLEKELGNQVNRLLEAK